MQLTRQGRHVVNQEVDTDVRALVRALQIHLVGAL